MAVDAKLWVPSDVYVNLMPPIPDPVLVSVAAIAFLTNQSEAEATVCVGRPCDVHRWKITDAQGNLIQEQEPQNCPHLVVTEALAPHETIRGDGVLPLNGTRLEDGQRYTVHYWFWGLEATDRFVVHHVF